jgi:ribosome-binding protein aMBF1 (putative translation factor)
MSKNQFNTDSTQDLENLILRGKNFHVNQQKKREGKFEEKIHQETEEQHRMKKLDKETENLTITKVNSKVSQAIIKGRVAKKWNRKQLAMNTKGLSESIIASYETGKAIPNINEIRKIENALKIKLTGKDFK